MTFAYAAIVYRDTSGRWYYLDPVTRRTLYVHPTKTHWDGTPYFNLTDSDALWYRLRAQQRELEDPTGGAH